MMLINTRSFAKQQTLARAEPAQRRPLGARVLEARDVLQQLRCGVLRAASKAARGRA